MVQLPFGQTALQLTLPAGARVLRQPGSPPLPDVGRAVAHALDHPLGTAPLGELARGRQRACVVISDITRPVPNRVLLPPLLERLRAAGISPAATELLVATGTHRVQTPDEVVALVGPEVLAAGYRVRSHDCRSPEQQVALGRTSRGIPVEVDRGYCGADLRILVGLIEPHLMAGWSGGRKSVCPGICSLRTILTFHAARLLAHPKAANGILDGNPVHEQALEAARLARADFILNVTLAEDRQVTGVFAGELDLAHRTGVEQAGKGCQVEVPERVDVVVTTSGGYPLDSTLYQAAKGAVAAVPIVRRGGAIVLVAACTEGLGSPDFVRAFAYTPQEFARALLRPGFQLFEQWQAQELCLAARHARLFLVTTRNDELAPAVARGWLTTCATPQAALQSAQEAVGGKRVVVMPSGPYLLARVAGL